MHTHQTRAAWALFDADPILRSMLPTLPEATRTESAVTKALSAGVAAHPESRPPLTPSGP